MRVLIVEDEHAAAKRLQKMLLDIDPSVEVADQLESIESAMAWFSGGHASPDLIFMDIHLADGSCFELFNLVDIQSPVIFTTAYDQYAIEAFRVNAVDYLLKPIKHAELGKALEKLKKYRKSDGIDYLKVAEALRLKQDGPNKRFLIRIGQSIKVVEISEVAYFYTEDKITFLTTKGAKRYPIEYSLEKLEEMANPHQFFRINRQFIVNINAIKEMYAYSKSRVKILLDPPCPVETVVSTERSPVFKKWLTGEEGTL